MLTRSRARRNDVRRVAVLAAAGVILVPAASAPAAPVWVERGTVAMGTTLHATVAAPSAHRGIAAIETAFGRIAETEALLSTWRPGTELARANRAPVGQGTPLSQGLVAMLAATERWRVATGGAFDPAIGALVDAWDLRGAGRSPDRARLARARAATGARAVRVDPAAGTLTRLDPDAWVDAGAFGKGAALGAAADALADAGVRDAFLNFGGQILALGHAPRGRGWPVPVAHPAVRDRAILTLRVAGRSVATSAQSERFVSIDGTRYGHVLDPRTGRPVPAWGSVTVVHRDPLVADILATALLVMGPEDGPAWADRGGGVAAVFLVDRGHRVDVRCTAAVIPYVEAERTCT